MHQPAYDIFPIGSNFLTGAVKMPPSSQREMKFHALTSTSFNSVGLKVGTLGVVSFATFDCFEDDPVGADPWGVAGVPVGGGREAVRAGVGMGA